MKKRILGLLLAVCMTLTMLPTTALARTTDPGGRVADHLNALNTIIKDDDSLWTWGGLSMNNAGYGDQLSGYITGENPPVREQPGFIMNDVLTTAQTFKIIYVVKTDYSLWGWGGLRGEMLLDDTNPDWVSFPEKLMDNVKAVSASSRLCTMVVKTDGSLLVWGSNINGLNGNGILNRKAAEIPITAPVKVMDGVESVLCDINRYYAIKTDGSLWVWGLVPMTTTGEVEAPHQIADNVKMIAVGPQKQIMILKKDGSLWGMGPESSWFYGTGKTENPGNTAIHMADGVKYIHTPDDQPAAFLIKENGDLYGWGPANEVLPLGASGYDNYNMGMGTELTVPTKLTSKLPGNMAYIGGSDKILAVTEGGELYGWGVDVSGAMDSFHVNIVPKYITSGIRVPGANNYLLGASSWAKGELKAAKEAGLTYDAILTSYQAPINRLEFCKLAVNLYKALGAPLPSQVQPSPFTDTSDPDVALANQLGIVSGVGEGKFAPEVGLTREQMSAMLMNVCKLVENPAVTNDLSGKFTDAGKVSPWALESLRYMNQIGIINGSNGLIDPQGSASREMSILMAYRTYAAQKDKSGDLFQDGVYTLVPAGGKGLCADVNSQSTKAGALIGLWNRNDGDNQKFKLEKSGEGYLLTGVQSGLVLTAGNNQITQEPKGQAGQLLRLEYHPGGTVCLVNEAGQYLDIQGGAAKAGVKLLFTAKSGTQSQQFILTKLK